MTDVRLAEIEIVYAAPLRHLSDPRMPPVRGSFVYRVRRDGRPHLSGSCQGSEIGRGGAPRALHRGIEAARGAGYTHYVIRGEEHDPIPLAG